MHLILSIAVVLSAFLRKLFRKQIVIEYLHKFVQLPC